MLYIESDDTLSEMLPELGEHFSYEKSILDREYPHVAKTIVAIWGSSECMNYMEDLIGYTPTEERLSRQGFLFEAVKELNWLILHHQEKFPFLDSRFKRRSQDPWHTAIKIINNE